MVRRAAIILAGGRGARFQSEKTWHDKALAPLFGKPLLIHAIENVHDVVDEVVVCVNDEERKARYAKILKDHEVTNVGLVVDEKIDHLGGPLVAIFSGLKSVKADYCLTLPGDMPLVQPKIIEYMFEKAKDARVVVPMWSNGRLETLVMVLEKNSTLQIADTLCQLGRPRSDDLIRGALNVTFVSIVGELSTLDPELKSFVNINFPEDLVRLQPRKEDDKFQDKVTQNLHINRGTLPVNELQNLRMAVSLCKESQLFEAAKVFSSCAANLENEKSFFWAAVSRENEGKTLRSSSKHQSEPSLIKAHLAESKAAFLKAANTYGLEAKMHEERCCLFLVDRALSDKAWCESRATELK
jgi:molybdopterin-guanine dinucleotide biosynthesis protein A